MKRQSSLPIAVVAAVTVAAVVLGGTIASRHVPRSEDVAAAAPLPTSGPPTLSGPAKVTLAVHKLSTGRLPQIPYVVGREVRGGAGDQVKIPGTETILEIARVNGSVLAVTTNDNGWTLRRLEVNGATTIADVSHLEVSDDQAGAAYVAFGGSLPPTEGGAIYADSGTDLKSLELKTGWNFKVLAYAAGKVYYQSSDVLGGGATWSTYEWTPGDSKATLAKAIPNLTKMTADGKTAASTLVVNDTGSCSAINAVSNGVRAWKTCDYYLDRFSPSGATVFGAPASADNGSCAPTVPATSAEAAVDTKTGQLLREWKGCLLVTVAPEDDDHLLMIAIAPGNTKSAIVRCAISTGRCELATPLSTDPYILSS
jgi:hypothetical protein